MQRPTTDYRFSGSAIDLVRALREAGLRVENKPNETFDIYDGGSVFIGYIDPRISTLTVLGGSEKLDAALSRYKIRQ